MNDDDKPRLEIDWVKTFAGALAAVSTAVLLSTLGAAGTLIGAALGSIVVTISSAFYSQGLARSKQRLATAQAVAVQKVGKAQAEVRRANRTADKSTADEHLAQAEEELDEVHAELADPTLADAMTWQERFVLLPWKRIGIGAAGLFLAAILVITGFELLSGRTVASFTGGSDSTGGTSLTRLTGGDSKNDNEKQKNKDEESPSEDPSPSDGPSEQPSSSESTEPSQTPSDDVSESPSAEPTDVPSETPTEAPTTPPELEASPAG